MLQTILIFSPLIVLFLSSLVIFVFGLRNYISRIEKQSVDPNGQTGTLIAFGAMGLAGSGSILLFVFTLSTAVRRSLEPFCGGFLSFTFLKRGGSIFLITAVGPFYSLCSSVVSFSF